MIKQSKVHFQEDPYPRTFEQQDNQSSQVFKHSPQLLQGDLNITLSRALRNTHKISERDLTLVEILNAYDLIIKEDEMNADLKNPQICPENRSKLYLELLKFKKQQEQQELQQINQDILNFQSIKSNQEPFVPNLKTNSIIGQIQDSLDSQNRKRRDMVDSQMIPEKQINKDSQVHYTRSQYVTFSHEDGVPPSRQPPKQFKNLVNQVNDMNIFSPEASIRSNNISSGSTPLACTRNQAQAKWRSHSNYESQINKSKNFINPSNQRLKFNSKKQEKNSRNLHQKRKSTDSRGQKNLSKLSTGVNQTLSSELLPKKKYGSLRAPLRVFRRPQEVDMKKSQIKKSGTNSKGKKATVHQKFMRKASEFENQNQSCIINITQDRSPVAPSLFKSKSRSPPSRQALNAGLKKAPRVLMIANNTSNSRSRSRSKSSQRPSGKRRKFPASKYDYNDQENLRQCTRNKREYQSSASGGQTPLSRSVSLDKKFQYNDKSSTGSDVQRPQVKYQNRDLSGLQNKIDQAYQQLNQESANIEEMMEDEGDAPSPQQQASYTRSYPEQSKQGDQTLNDYLNQGDESYQVDESRAPEIVVTEATLGESKLVPDRLPKLSVSQLIHQVKLKQSSQAQLGIRQGRNEEASEERRQGAVSPASDKPDSSPGASPGTQVTQKTVSPYHIENTFIQRQLNDFNVLADGTGPRDRATAKALATAIVNQSQLSSSFDKSGEWPLRKNKYKSRFSNQQLQSSSDLQTSNKRGPRKTDSSSPVSANLAYALHYEGRLMRKAFQNLQAHNLSRQTKRLNYRISKQRYVKSLKMKALRALHTFFLKHFGHKNSKAQADTLYRYFLQKKTLVKWQESWRIQTQNINKIHKIREKMAFRTKMNVFVEWQAISLARQLYQAQKVTSQRFWEAQLTKKAYLSLKFYTKFSQKQSCMRDLIASHEKFRLGRKALFALRENIEIRNHKKEKILLAFKIYEHNCQKSTFLLFKQVCKDRAVERQNRTKSKDYHKIKVLQKCWHQWQIFKIIEAKNRLNTNLASEFRQQVLQRALLVNLQISNQIFKKIYNDEKIRKIHAENLGRRCLEVLKLYAKKKMVKVSLLPQNLAYFFFANLWWSSKETGEKSVDEDPQVSKSRQKLQGHFQKKLNEYYTVKAFYTLQDNYESLKAFKRNWTTQKTEKVFVELKKYTKRKGAQRYKEELIRGKRQQREMFRVFLAIYMRGEKRKSLRARKEALKQQRLDRVQYRVLLNWHLLQIKLQRKREQKIVSRSMHDRRYIDRYFSTWIAKYNKSRRKAYLESLRKTYVTEKRRNKFFTLWMQIASASMSLQIHEAQIGLGYCHAVKKKVFGALRYLMIQKKRRLVIFDIINEKHTNLLIMKTLEKWQMRFHDHAQKRMLYDQIDSDYRSKLLLKAFVTLKEDVQDQKEAKIEELMQRQRILDALGSD